jgi:hypothetical protein
MISQPHCFGPVVKQHIMVRVCGREKLLASWSGSKKERERG